MLNIKIGPQRRPQSKLISMQTFRFPRRHLFVGSNLSPILKREYRTDEHNTRSPRELAGLPATIIHLGHSYFAIIISLISGIVIMTKNRERM